MTHEEWVRWRIRDLAIEMFSNKARKWGSRLKWYEIWREA